ncbi:hypothetical protein ACFL0F_00565 [Patescibacteria group bacterium]
MNNTKYIMTLVITLTLYVCLLLPNGIQAQVINGDGYDGWEDGEESANGVIKTYSGQLQSIGLAVDICEFNPDKCGPSIDTGGVIWCQKCAPVAFFIDVWFDGNFNDLSRYYFLTNNTTGCQQSAPMMDIGENIRIDLYKAPCDYDKYRTQDSVNCPDLNPWDNPIQRTFYHPGNRCYYWENPFWTYPYTMVDMSGNNHWMKITGTDNFSPAGYVNFAGEKCKPWRSSWPDGTPDWSRVNCEGIWDNRLFVLMGYTPPPEPPPLTCSWNAGDIALKRTDPSPSATKCTKSNWNSPRADNCYTKNTSVQVKIGGVPLAEADKVKFAKVPSSTNCLNYYGPWEPSVSEGWLNVSSSINYDILPSPLSGNKKVCAIFNRNDTDYVKCEAMLDKLDLRCTNSSLSCTPSYTLYPNDSTTCTYGYTKGSDVDMDRVRFTHSGGYLTPSSPKNDTSSPFSATFTASNTSHLTSDINISITANPTTSTDEGDLPISPDCVSRSRSITLKAPPPPDPWWQAKDGDVKAYGRIISPVPSGEYFNLSGDGGYPGVSVFNLDKSISVGGESRITDTSVDWNAESNYSSSFKTKYDYEYFNRKVPSEVTENWDNDDGIISSPDQLESECSDDTRENGYCWLKSEGSLDLVRQDDMGGEKIILLVEGDLNINDDINATLVSDDFFMAVVDGNITIDPSVDFIDGVYLAERKFITETTGSENDKRFSVYGSVAAWDGVSLRRNRGYKNTLPAERFFFSPKYYLEVPFGERTMTWKEVAP